MRHFFYSTLIALFLVTGGCTKQSSTSAVPGKISGKITVDQQLAPSLKPTDVLFIIVRSQQAGPPTAVKRIVNPKFPLEYVVGPEDAMMGGSADFSPSTPLTVAARLSRTGDAMPATGDIEGTYKDNPAKAGTGGIDILIDRVRQ